MLTGELGMRFAKLSGLGVRNRAIAIGSALAIGITALTIDPSTAATTYRLWSDSARPSVVAEVGDKSTVELGVKFKSSVAGSVTAIKFYKASTNTGTHKASLWSSRGTRLATAAFTNESTSGWQTVNLSTPVKINAGETYVASYLAPNGNYSYNYDAFPHKSGVLTASRNAGVFKYGGGFPTENWRNSNYWVDVVVSAGVANTTTTTTRPATTTSTTAKPVVTTTTTTAAPTTTTTAKPAVTTTSTTVLSGTPGTCGPVVGFPSANCVGYKHTGIALKACEQYASNGNYVINGSAAGTVVDGCRFAGKQVIIKGGGPVTLKRSFVSNNDFNDTAGAAIFVAQGAGPVLIEDVEVTTTDPTVTNELLRQDRSIGVAKNNNLPLTLRRVHAHDTVRNIDITGQVNVTIEDSYLGPNVNPGSGERKHSSGIRAAGGVSNFLLKNTVVEMGSNAWASGILATYEENGDNHAITVDGGLWVIGANNSGAYGIAAGYTVSSGNRNYDFTIKNLQISTQYNSGGCPSGCAQNWTSAGSPGIAPLDAPKVWSNVTKYNPGKPDHGQQMTP